MVTDRLLILVTNDDGLLSPGLRAAAEAVADLGELLLVAPATQQTAMSRPSSGTPTLG
jgi:5'/3'-nucleotidase